MNDAPPPKKRTWIWIVLGVLFVLFVIAIGGIIFSVSFLRQSMTITDVSPTSADEQFEAVRAKFAGQKPLIQMIDGRPQYVDDRDQRAAVDHAVEDHARDGVGRRGREAGDVLAAVLAVAPEVGPDSAQRLLAEAGTIAASAFASKISSATARVC